MSESELEFFTGIENLSHESYWEDFGDIMPDLDTIENSLNQSQYPDQSHAFTLGDIAEQQDLYQRIQSSSFFTQSQQQQQQQQQQQTSQQHINMPDVTPTTPFSFQRHNFFDPCSDSDLDPFRPLSSNSNHQHSRASSIIDLTDSPPFRMAPKRKLHGAAAASHAAKKRRLSTTQGSSPSSRESTHPPKMKVETVDLTEMDKYEAFETKQKREMREREALEAQRTKEEAAKSKKLAGFECVICLDNPTDLVITHCGHLFCSACIHHALDSGPGGSRCPSCRAKIVTKNLGHGRENKSSYYPLEIKLKFSTKGGKRKA